MDSKPFPCTAVSNRGTHANRWRPHAAPRGPTRPPRAPHQAQCSSPGAPSARRGPGRSRCLPGRSSPAQCSCQAHFLDEHFGEPARIDSPMHSGRWFTRACSGNAPHRNNAPVRRTFGPTRVNGAGVGRFEIRTIRRSELDARTDSPGCAISCADRRPSPRPSGRANALRRAERIRPRNR